jgi:hypothetical protein
MVEMTDRIAMRPAPPPQPIFLWIFYAFNSIKR